MTASLQDKRVLVVGMARSGLAAARLLASHGAIPILSDMRADLPDSAIAPLVALGCEARLGEPSELLLAGVSLAVVSPAVPPAAPVLAEAGRLGIPVWSELELAARYLRGMQLAITGTNGKTTTASLLGCILENAGKAAYVAGNIGLPLSTVAEEAGEDAFTVIEVSSFQLEHIDCFHPTVAALLNLTPDHLNRHGDMAAYGALKEGMLRNQLAGDFFIYNADDAFCRAVASRATAQALPFSRTQALREGACVADGQVILSGRTLCGVDELSLPGPHNLENALAAAAMAGVLDIPPAVIRHALRSFQGVAHRMELVRVRGGVRWINDSKGTNPESSIGAVMGMQTPTVLIAGGDEKGSDFAPFAQAIAGNRNIRHVLLIGRTAARIEAALLAAGYTEILHMGADLAQAVAQADALSAQQGGTVLLSPACASFDMFEDFEARGNCFKDLVNRLD